jgi:hypothetical protein
MANSPATIFNTLLPLPAILMMGGQEMTKRNVDDTRCGRRSRPAVIGLLFNQLSAYLFAFSGIRFDRIVKQDCTKRWYQ